MILKRPYWNWNLKLWNPVDHFACERVITGIVYWKDNSIEGSIVLVKEGNTVIVN
jgi:hypothetical protein